MSFTAQRVKCQHCGTEFFAYPNRRGQSGKYPKFCCRACYTAARNAEAASRKAIAEYKKRKAEADETLVRVPAKFFDDHEERECEPFCEPVRRTDRFVWLRLSDAGLGELFSDASHYADEWGPDAIDDGGGLKRSAAATVRAIEAARNGKAAAK